jgi:type III pantothenate kinase
MMRDKTILCFDIGNSRVKWGLATTSVDAKTTEDRLPWLLRGAWSTHEMAANAADIISKLFDDFAKQSVPPPRMAAICCVAQPAVAEQIQAQLMQRGVTSQCLLSQTHFNNLHNGYEHPEKLGVDRWMGLIGAHALGECNQVVVLAGTALTVDCLTSAGQHLGGTISAGLTTSRRALHSNTEQLPMVRSDALSRDGFCHNTQQAIAQGTIDALCGSVLMAVIRMHSAGFSPSRVLVSGGDAAVIMDGLSVAIANSSANEVFSGLTIQHRETLVLDGVLRSARV